MVAGVALVGAGDGRLWGDLDCCSLPSKELTTQDSWPESYPTGAVLQTAGVAQRLAAGREGEARVRALFVAELPHRHVGPQQLAGARPHGRHRPARRGR